MTVVLILVALTCGVIYGLSRPKPNLTINMAPTVAKLTLNNGKSLKNGEQYLIPGTYAVTATMAGFGDVSQHITVTKGGHTKVTILLDPNSSAGETYLKNHPTEGLNREAIGGRRATDAAAKAVAENPLINQLPYIGPGYEFQIDYGAGSDGTAKIIITAPDDTSRTDALTWITKQGYDINKLNIEFKTAKSGYTHSPSVGQ